MAEYRIEDCTLYRKSCVISGVPVYIFEDHNMALPAWGTVCSRIGCPVNLVTFDFHTDTLFGFRTHIYEETGELPEVWKYGLKNPIVKELLNGARYSINDFSFEDMFCVSIEFLKNDEQIMCGMDLGYLQSYTVVNRENSEAEEYESYDKLNGYAATYTDRKKWNLWNSEEVTDPIIVDFDLDFFGKETDIDEEFVRKVSPLIKRARAITIATEPKFFEECKEDKTFTNDKALEQLLSFIAVALDNQE